MNILLFIIPIFIIFFLLIIVYLTHTTTLMYKSENDIKTIINPDGSRKKITGVSDENKKLMQTGKIANGEIVRFEVIGGNNWSFVEHPELHKSPHIYAEVEYYNIFEKRVVCVRTPELNGGRNLIGDAKCTVYYDEFGNFYVTNFTKQKFLKIKSIKLKYDDKVQ